MWQNNQVNSGKEVTKQLLGSGLRETAADEVDNFERIAVLKLGGGPAITGEQIAVEFDSDAVGLHVQLDEQVRHCRDRDELAIFAVNGKSHSATSLFQFSSHRGLEGQWVHEAYSQLQTMHRLASVGIFSWRCGLQRSFVQAMKPLPLMPLQREVVSRRLPTRQ